jgi:chromosome segregation ATPase
MTQLFLLSAEYRAAADKLADLDLDEATIADTLESLSGELEVKATNVAMYARNLEATAASIKDAEAQMAARRKAIENRAAGLRRYLLASMQQATITRIESPHFVLAIKNNPPAVDVFDFLQVPKEYMKQPEPPPAVVDKAAVKEALKRNIDVPGCRLTHGQRLEIA